MVQGLSFRLMRVEVTSVRISGQLQSDIRFWLGALCPPGHHGSRARWSRERVGFAKPCRISARPRMS